MAVSSRVAKALHQRLHSSAASGKPSRWRRRQHQQQHQQQHVRSLAVPAAQTMKKDGAQQQQQVFDRTAKTQQRSRAAKADDSRAYDYLRAEAADRLVDRLRDVRRQFPRVLDIGASHGALLPHLAVGFGVEEVVQVESSESMLMRDAELPEHAPEGVAVHRLAWDEEHLLLPPGMEEMEVEGFRKDLLYPGSFDCVVSNLALHWMNDLPGVMIQAQHLLKPDGIFLAVMLGGDSLYELRNALALAEQERDGGISPRVSPQISTDDAGSLLTRAGFKLLTVDTDQIVVPYPDALTLMHELRGMGESNAVTMRRGFLPRETLLAAAAIYEELYGDVLDSGETVIPATFELVYMIGWAPGADQPAALERGTATTSLTDVLGSSASSPAAAGAEHFSLQDIAKETGGTAGRVTLGESLPAPEEEDGSGGEESPGSDTTRT